MDCLSFFCRALRPIVTKKRIRFCIIIKRKGTYSILGVSALGLPYFIGFISFMWQIIKGSDSSLDILLFGDLLVM